MPSVIHNCCNQLGFIIHSTPPVWASPRQEDCYCNYYLSISFSLPLFHNTFYWIVSVWEKRIFHFFRIHEIRNTLTKTKYIRKTLLFEGSFLILFFQKISFTLSLFVKDEHHMEVIISSSRYNFQIFKNLSFSTVVKQKKIFTFFLSTPHILVCPHPHN